jgi:hypothetical protein
VLGRRDWEGDGLRSVEQSGDDVLAQSGFVLYPIYTGYRDGLCSGSFEEELGLEANWRGCSWAKAGRHESSPLITGFDHLVFTG